MSNEVLPFVPDYVLNLLQEASDDYVADVLRPWDCYEQKWADDYMRLFRFESDDVLIWFENGSFQGRKGAVDSRSFDIPDLVHTEMNPAEDMCLCWRTDTDYRSVIGNQIPATELLDEFF